MLISCSDEHKVIGSIGWPAPHFYRVTSKSLLVLLQMGVLLSSPTDSLHSEMVVS